MNIYNVWHETQSLYTSCSYRLTVLVSPMKVMCILISSIHINVLKIHLS